MWILSEWWCRNGRPITEIYLDVEMWDPKRSGLQQETNGETMETQKGPVQMNRKGSSFSPVGCYG
jgi:hypothetical protein